MDQFRNKMFLVNDIWENEFNPLLRIEFEHKNTATPPLILLFYIPVQNQFQICNNSESHKQVFLCISQSKSFLVFNKTIWQKISINIETVLYYC